MKKNYWQGVIGYTRASFIRFFRDKTALFFTFLFPLIFLFVFGSIFNNRDVDFKVAVINHAQNDFAKAFEKVLREQTGEVLKIKDVANMEEAQKKMKHSELYGVIEIPEEFGVKNKEGRPSGKINALFAKGEDQAGSLLSAIIGQLTDEFNRRLGHPEAPLKVEALAVGDESLKPFDYTFTGMLSFSLMSMGVFGLANILPTEKKQGIFRRLRAAPFTSGQLIIATALVYITIAMISLLTMVAVGLAVFQFNMRGSWLIFSIFALLGSIMMTGVGLAIGGWARTENQSAPIANLISMPMMFLSGTFFPTFLFPDWLQKISQFVPISPITISLRRIMTENAQITELLPQLGLIGIWILVIYLIAIKLFRWE